MRNYLLTIFIIISSIIGFSVAHASIIQSAVNLDITQLCAINSTQSENELLKLAFWNQCTKDDDCGVDHKCCNTNDGTRCYRVDTCAPAN
jgi:hypothetical protein